jgi:nicotinamide-nucleotide amidase
MPLDLSALAAETLRAADGAGLTVAAAESCTGGHIASMLTGIEGLSHVFEAGFVTYSDKAKSDVLGIPGEDVSQFGAVSREVALAMAAGALKSSRSNIAVAVTGFTGGAPPGEENGLVHIAVVDETGRSFHREYHFGEVERIDGRDLAAGAALAMLKNAIAAPAKEEQAA